MKDIINLKDFLKSNLGGRINKNNFNVVTFTSSDLVTPSRLFMCWQNSLYIPDDFINEVYSLYLSAGLKCISKQSGIYGTTVYFSSYLEIDLNYAFRKIFIWSIKDDLDI